MSYRVLITDEATDDVFNLVKYIHVDLCNPDAANKLYTNLNREVNNMGDFPLKFADDLEVFFCPFLSGSNFPNKQSMVQYLRNYHQGMSSGP